MPRGSWQRPRQTRYQPLIDFLAKQAGGEVTLTFAAIEGMIGVPLSVTATNHATLWHSPLLLHVRGWQQIGWHAHFDRRHGCVHFTRNAPEG